MQERNRANAQGIDVSHHNGLVEWDKVAADQIRFAFVKSSEGQNMKDSRAEENVRGAKASGLLVGLYHYLVAKSSSDAKQEAQNIATVYNRLGGKDYFELPPVLDYEDNRHNLGPAAITTIARAFLLEVERLTGARPVIYTSQSFAEKLSGLSGEYDIWVARYSLNKPEDIEKWSRWRFWQYSDGQKGGYLPGGTRKVSGVSGYVDLNEYDGNYEDLKKRYGKGEVAVSNPFEGYRLTSPFGMRKHPITGKQKFHRGVDLVTTPGNGPIYAFAGGTVRHAKDGAPGSGFGNYGITVAIEDNKGRLHVYAHLSAATVKVGQVVAKGDQIGNQGNTGASAGNHLHYEVRKVASPSFGYTATEAGVLEPTQYLKDYYAVNVPKPEVDELSATEKQELITLRKENETLRKDVDALTNSKDVLKKGMQEQGSLLKKLVERVDKLESTEVPAWAKDAVDAFANTLSIDGSSPVITDQKVGPVVAKMLVILHRLGLATSKGGK